MKMLHLSEEQGIRLVDAEIISDALDDIISR